jgi:regulatory protein
MSESESLVFQLDEVEQARQFIYKKAIDLLSRREHSREELAQKLRLKSSASDEILDALLPELLDGLSDQGYLSDERYAEMVIRSRFAKGQGPIRIRLELKQKGIDAAIINSNFDEFDADWFELAATTQRKRFGERPLDLPARAKQMRFLASRGFSSEHIEYALSSSTED